MWKRVIASDLPDAWWEPRIGADGYTYRYLPARTYDAHDSTRRCSLCGQSLSGVAYLRREADRLEDLLRFCLLCAPIKIDE